MNQTLAEAFILAATALEAGLLLFVAGVVQKLMNDMEPAAFKQFLSMLDKTAQRNIFALSVSLITSVAAIPYFILYGFNHWWFTAGIVVWFVAAFMSKLFNLPIYKWVEMPANTDAVAIKQHREELQRANNLRAWATLLSVVLMVMQFVKW